ncbi:MAG: hypothetical protein GF384_05685 [Elusimicrobia bacterium]|nr:hypothetical protein [Elusimicrobiota bacterium]MBD3412256.1 hypothetical protein [Elusimicrobiota bacterium]
MQNNAEKINPWLNIWFRPRETFNYVLNNPHNLHKGILIFLGGFSYSLSRAYGLHLGNTLGFEKIIIFSLMLGPISGLVVVYLGSFILKTIGRIFKGIASYSGLQSVIIWSMVPLIGLLPIWLIRFLLLGAETFTASGAARGWNSPVLLLLNGIHLGLALWMYVILAKGLSVAEGFSMWKAIGTMLIAFMVFIVLFVIIALTFLPLF